MLDRTSAWKLRDGLVLHGLDPDNGLCWLFDIVSGACFDLNGVAFDILSHLDGERSVGQSLQALVARYEGVSHHVLESDLEEFFAELVAKGLLVRVEEAEGSAGRE